MHPTATAAMAEEKGKVAMVGISEPYYVERPCAAGARGKAKSRHVLMAVTSVVVVAMLVAGIIGAAYVFKSAVKDIEKYHMKLDGGGDKPTSEDVESDVTDNIVTYHLMTAVGEQWVLNDFSKGITLYKTIENENTACYVTPLNHSEANPEQVRAYMKERSERDVDGSDAVVFRIMEDPIENPDFLGNTINSMCDGVSIFWIRSTCAGNGDGLTAQPYPKDVDTPSRRKREVRRCIVCGCRLLCAPWMRGSYYYENGWKCRLQYAGSPAYLWNLDEPCNRPLAWVNVRFPDATTPAVPTTPTAAEEKETKEMSTDEDTTTTPVLP